VPALLVTLRPALHGLTTRGRSFISAGVASAICAVLLGQEDLLRVAVLLASLPLGCAVMLIRAHYRIGLTRTVTPSRATVGTPLRIRLELQNLARLSTRVLLAEDRVPYALGAAPRFVLDRMPGGQQAAVTYSLQAEIRGRYPIGPLRLRVADPFGMCELTRSFTATDHVMVVPRLWPLTPMTGGGIWGGAGDSLARAAAVSGEDDIAIREYREGDDLRRVHWRSTAKRGELMVRREEQPRQMRATVLLDARPRGHRGDGPASSFEWAVSAAASVAVHFAGLRHGVRLVLDGQPSTWSNPHSGEAAGELLDQMAVVALGDDDSLDAGIDMIRRTGGDGVVVAVLGDIDDAKARELAHLGSDGKPGIAILIRTEEWSTRATRVARDSGSHRDRAITILRDAGWVVAEAGAGQTVTDVWAQATGIRNQARGSGFDDDARFDSGRFDDVIAPKGNSSGGGSGNGKSGDGGIGNWVRGAAR
jgi:uncharacterized protein (DUF58 family)